MSAPTRQTDRAEIAGVAFVALSALGFGAGPTLAKLAYGEGVTPLAIQVFRFAPAFLVVALLVALRGERPAVPPRRRLLLAALAGLTCCTSFSYLSAVQFIPVGPAALTFFTFPAIVGVISHLTGGERLTRPRALALAVAFGGLALVLGDVHGGLDWRGVLLAFVAANSVALSFLTSHRLTREVPTLHVSFWVTLAAALTFAAVTLATGTASLPTAPPGWIGALGIGLTFTLGICCGYAGIRRLGPLRAAVVVNLEPLVNVAAAYLVLDERLTGVQLAGVALVLGGIVLVQATRGRG